MLRTIFLPKFLMCSFPHCQLYCLEVKATGNHRELVQSVLLFDWLISKEKVQCSARTKTDNRAVRTFNRGFLSHSVTILFWIFCVLVFAFCFACRGALRAWTELSVHQSCWHRRTCSRLVVFCSSRYVLHDYLVTKNTVHGSCYIAF